MKNTRTLCFATVFFSLSGVLAWASLPDGTLASVNGKAITPERVKELFGGGAEAPVSPGAKLSAAEKLGRTIFFELALDAARRDKIDALPEVKQEMDRLLYEQFLRITMNKKGLNEEPSAKEVETYYQEKPLLKVRHLVLFERNEKEKKAAAEKLDQIEKSLIEKKPFDALVMKYSQDQDAKLGGELDARGAHNFPPEFYSTVKALNPGQVTKAITSSDALHLFQLVKKTPYSVAPFTYLQFLKEDLRVAKMSRFSQELLAQLKRDARIEVKPGTAVNFELTGRRVK